MIIEIAPGIVLAYVILSLFPLIIAGGIVLILLAALVAVAAAAFYNWQTALIIIGGVVTFGLSLGLPYALGLHLTRRYDVLERAINAKPPFDHLRALPHRLALMLPFVIGTVALGFAVLALCLAELDHLEAFLKHRR